MKSYFVFYNDLPILVHSYFQVSKMKIKILFLYTGLIVCGNAWTQNTFSKVYYGNTAGVIANDMVSTFDDGFIIAGHANSGYVLKIDSAGNPIWSKDINCGAFTCAGRTSDSCYVLGGTKYNSTFVDACCTKINSAGNVIWSKTITTGQYMQISSVQETFDLGYVITGNANLTSTVPQIFVAKIDASGNLQWSHFIAMADNTNEGLAIKQAPDSSYYLSGFAENYPPYDPFCFLFRISPSGNISWAKRYSSAGYLEDFLFTKNGILFYLKGGNGAFLMRTDLGGNILWSKIYDVPGWISTYGQQKKINSTSDSSFVFVSGDCEPGSSRIVKVDSAGNVIWVKGLMLNALQAIQGSDSGYCIVGNGPLCGVKVMQTYGPQIGVIKVNSAGNANTSSWMSCVMSASCTAVDSVIISSAVSYTVTNAGAISSTFPIVSTISLNVDSGCVSILGAVTENDFENGISVSPNPSQGIFIFKNTSPSSHIVQINIWNTLGENVYTAKALSSEGRIDLRKELPGIYFYKAAFSDGSIQSGKIVIQ